MDGFFVSLLFFLFFLPRTDANIYMYVPLYGGGAGLCYVSIMYVVQFTGIEIVFGGYICTSLSLSLSIYLSMYRYI